MGQQRVIGFCDDLTPVRLCCAWCDRDYFSESLPTLGWSGVVPWQPEKGEIGPPWTHVGYCPDCYRLQKGNE